MLASGTVGTLAPAWIGVGSEVLRLWGVDNDRRVANDLQTVRGVLSMLAGQGIHTWIFGGWAEELHGIVPSRAHADIDLLYSGQDIGRVDRAIRQSALHEIVAKRFAHKRAFMVDSVMVELFLVRSDRHGPHTNFWDRWRHDWPSDVFGSVNGAPVASQTALRDYRAQYPLVRAAGWDRGDHTEPTASGRSTTPRRDPL